MHYNSPRFWHANSCLAYTFINSTIKKMVTMDAYRNFSCIKAVLFCLLAACVSPVQASCNTAEKQNFKIPSQSVKDALLKLSIQCDLTLVVRFSDVEFLDSYPLDGDYLVNDALQLLLKNTHLDASVSDHGFIKIQSSQKEFYANNLPPQPVNFANTIEDEVTVTGLRRSLYSATEIKRNADVIEDVITEYDIVKMPDKGVSESLQRISGVSIEKRLGDGTKVNVRGFSENLTLFNGETFLTGMEYFQLGWDDQSYEGSLEAIPIEMMNQINVYKSFKPSDIEGSIGGTVDLLGRNPLDIHDNLFAVESGAETGDYSQKKRPYTIVTLGKNWNEKFAAVLTLSSNNKTTHIDFAQNYLDRPLVYEIKKSEKNDAILPHLVPQYSKVDDTEQDRKRTSVILGLAYSPSDDIELKLDLMNLNNQLKRRDYEIWHEIKYARSDGGNTFNNDHAIPFVTSGTYNQIAQKFSTIAETAKSNANNVAFTLNWAPTEALAFHNILTYSEARFDQELANAEVFHSLPLDIHSNLSSEIGTLPVWVGKEFIDPTDSSKVYTPKTGWIDYYLTCVACRDSSIGDIDYNNQRFDFSRYTNSEFYGQSDNAVSSYARANSMTELQSAWTLKGDVVWQPELENYSFSVGWRFANHQLEQKNYKYLTNLGETKGAAKVTQFDANGKVLAPSDYDPLRPGDDYNVGIREAYYSDLCNNGGIAAGKTCDIDGDGQDDNLPYGPWTYALDASETPLSVSRNTSNDEQPYSALFYGDAVNIPFSFGVLTVPGSVPWQSYQQNPAAYKNIMNYLPSQGPHSQIYFIDAEPMLHNIGQWIDARSPYSPTKKFSVPRNSFLVDQTISTLHGEFNFESDLWPFAINTGLRLIHTDSTIHTNTLNNLPKISLTSEDWEISGVGNGWSPLTQTHQYVDLLPSANLTWDFDENNKMRVSAGRTITRPNFQLLGQGLTPRYNSTRITLSDGSTRYAKIATAGKAGNPNLHAEQVKQADISLEHYYGLSNYVQLAFFAKKIDGEIIQGTQMVNISDESEAGFSSVPLFTPINTRRSRVNGMEIALQNTWQSGVGINFNYSYIDSESDLTSYSKARYGIPGISKHMLNATTFFETENFSIRLALNWRSEYVDPYNTLTQVNNLTKSKEFDNAILVHSYSPYLQADTRITWYPTDKVRLTLDALNLNKKTSQSFLEFQDNISSNLAVETHYVFGIKVSL
jgi:iron complex outermembrane recepter protein